jgi:hypothetical protein
LTVLYIFVIVPEVLDAILNLRKGVLVGSEAVQVVNGLELCSWIFTFAAICWYQYQLRGTVEEETAERLLLWVGVISVVLSITSSVLDFVWG